ncbi:MAG: class I SAM-dependent methyltransferase [Methanobacterium sp.]|nr:class I SAM-dependent methyltransferase [Methanobacterium sp.]
MVGKHGHQHHGKSSKDILSGDLVLEAANIKNGDKFLDAGCGDGHVSIDASYKVGKDGKVFAIDIYPDSIEILKNEIKNRNIKNIKPLVADITEELPLEDNSIDLALMANVLHGFVHSGEVDQMSNIVKVLKPGGIFAVAEFRKAESSRGPPIHIRISPEEVGDILKKYHFEVVDSYEIGEYHYIVRGLLNK